MSEPEARSPFARVFASRVFSLTSLIATAVADYSNHQADEMPILYYSERAAMSFELFQASLVLAVLALLFERPRKLAALALAASLLIAAGGQLRSGHGGGQWANQETCAERQRYLLEKLRDAKIIEGTTVPSGFEGPLTKHPPAVAAFRSTWDLSCVDEPIVLVNRATAKKSGLTGVACAHGVMTTLDGRTFVLPVNRKFDGKDRIDR